MKAMEELIPSVRSAVANVIGQEFKSNPEISLSAGFDSGDGYSSRSYAIALTNSEKTINLFVKYVPISENLDQAAVDVYSKVFKTEATFYSKIHPAFTKFQKDSGVGNAFDNVALYYPVDAGDYIPPVILQNLKYDGYVMQNRKEPLSHDVLKCILRTLAKFHAVSFAIKDKEPGLFHELTVDLGDVLSETFTDFGTDQLVKGCVNQVLDKLDPIADQIMVGKMAGLSDILIAHSSTINKQNDEYSVICHGDCWINNMMFMLDTSTGTPSDIKLLDFQMLRVNAPVLDVLQFFYSSASAEQLDRLDDYMKFYHDSLCGHIRNLGRDADSLYPFDVFIEHWRKFSKFGLTMAFMIVKVMLFENDEVPDFNETPSEGTEKFVSNIKNQDVYTKRMKTLLQHFIDKKFL